ncbi:MAG: Dyp-type peroxidase [Alphaproteobacteria bacterium]
MTTPQPGIFADQSRFHHALEYAVSEIVPLEPIRSAVAPALDRSRAAAGSVVVAFGRTLWGRLAPDHMPDGLEDFSAIDGWGDTGSPSTQGDIFLWFHGSDHDDVFDAARRAHRALDPVAGLTADVPGFTYRDTRDLTGFIDGTANPTGDDARAAALIPAAAPQAGGAFVLSQRWVHDLEAFDRLPVGEQEKIIGRTKPDSIELTGDAMPADSHVSRTDVSIDGVAQEIYRRSFPYGAMAEHGLYFLAFSCRIERFAVQLRRMFGASGDGVHDRLTEFSKPVTGSYWFAPSQETFDGVFT